MSHDIQTFETALDVIPYGEVLSGAVKVWEFASSFGQADPIDLAISWLQEEINELGEALGKINDRLNQNTQALVKLENQIRRDKLDAANGSVAGGAGDIAYRISLKPSNTDDRLILGHQASALVDEFMLLDGDGIRDIWQWTDMSVVRSYTDDTNIFITGTEVDTRLPPDFRARLALPVYGRAIMALIAAIDLDTGGDLITVRDRYGPVLLRHIAQTDPTPGVGPESLAEQIRARVSCTIAPTNIYAADGVCVFGYSKHNAMEHTTTFDNWATATNFAKSATVMCTYTPEMIAPWDEQFQDQDGVGYVTGLNRLLQTVFDQGSLRGQFIGQFVMTPVTTSTPEFLYGVKRDGSVDWFSQELVPETETAAGWNGPQQTRTGWESYSKIFPAGGHAINDPTVDKGIFYALTQVGELHWFQHDDLDTGGPGWTGPRVLDSGWEVFTAIIPGGDGVLYAIQSDGTLMWFKNVDFENHGFSTWDDGGRAVGSGWDEPARVFSVGNGVLYAVAKDGTLVWYRHMGFEHGESLWQGPITVGSGWQDFRDIFGTYPGVIYALQADGVLRQYVHQDWETGGGTWRAPITAAFNVGNYRQMLAMMPDLIPGPVH